MAEVARLNVLIQAKADRLENELDKASKRLDKFGTRMQSVGKKLSIGVTAPIVGIGAATIKAANDAEESENLFAVSMGRMADSARAFSEDVADSLGLNAFAIRENIGQFNALFTTLQIGETRAAEMAQTLTQLSADLASFFNISQDDAIRRLRSGLAGEAETLRRLNVFVNEATIQQIAFANGIARAGDELTEAQKVQARYLAIIEQTALAQGDLARTQESNTNQTRRFLNRIQELRVEIGQKLQPAYAALLRAGNFLVDSLGSLVDAFSRLPPGLQTTIIVFTGLAAAAGPLLVVLGGLTQILASLALVASTAVGSAALGGLAALFVSGAPLVLGITAGAVAVGALVAELTKSERKARDARRELEKFRASIDQPVTLDFVRDIGIETSLAAVKVSILRDELEAATEPLERLEIRSNLDEAIAELDRLQRRKELVNQIPIVTEATINADIKDAEAELTAILDRIDAIERGEVTFKPVTEARGALGLPRVIETSVEVRDEELRRLNQQADVAATNINNLSRELQQLQSTGADVQLGVETTIDPAIEEIFKALQADLRSLDTRSEVLSLSPLEVAEERASILRNALVQLADEGLGPNSTALVELAGRAREAAAALSRVQLDSSLQDLQVRQLTFDLSELEVARERVSLLRASIGRLIDEGLTPQDAALQRMIERLNEATVALRGLEAAEDVAAALEGMQQQIEILNGQRIALDLTDLEVAQQRLQILQSTIRSLLESGLSAGDPVVVGLSADASALAASIESQLDQTADIARSFEATFQQIGGGLVQAMARGALDAGDILLSAFSSLLGGVIGQVFGNIGASIGSVFSPQSASDGIGGLGPLGDQIGAAVAPNGGFAPMQLNAIVDMRGVTLFGDPAAAAREPGSQIFHREASLVARESGFG